MFKYSKIRLEKQLVQRAEDYAKNAGYSSVEELISHLLEREFNKVDEPEVEDEMKKKLQGLGYIS